MYFFFFYKENIIKLNIINFGQWLVLVSINETMIKNISNWEKKKKYYVDHHRHLTRLGALIILNTRFQDQDGQSTNLRDQIKFISPLFYSFFSSYKENKQSLHQYKTTPPYVSAPQDSNSSTIFLLSLIFPWIQKLHRKYSLTNPSFAQEFDWKTYIHLVG